MADIVIVFSPNDGFFEFVKKLEDGTLGMCFHEKHSLSGGQFPYGYNNSIHGWIENETDWRKEWSETTNVDGTPAYTEEDGWSDEASKTIFESLVNTYLVPELQNAANNHLDETKSQELTEQQWDSIASIAWNLGTDAVISLFEKINQSEDITQDGSAWILSKNETGHPSGYPVSF